VKDLGTAFKFVNAAEVLYDLDPVKKPIAFASITLSQATCKDSHVAGLFLRHVYFFTSKHGK
jgi:hypothetical protein